MRAVIQLVSKASVSVDSKLISSIDNGLLILLGVTHQDDSGDIDWLLKKIVNMRIFSDGDKMNLSVLDQGGSLLVVSQFTLMAKTKKGNRPSFIDAARPVQASALYDEFVDTARKEYDLNVETGLFGRMMEVELCNNGPVTLIVDSKNREL